MRLLVYISEMCWVDSSVELETALEMWFPKAGHEENQIRSFKIQIPSILPWRLCWRRPGRGPGIFIFTTLTKWFWLTCVQTTFEKYWTRRCLSLNFKMINFTSCYWQLSGKESTCQRRGCSFEPWSGKMPWRWKWQLTPVFLPREPHGT